MRSANTGPIPGNSSRESAGAVLGSSVKITGSRLERSANEDGKLDFLGAINSEESVR